MHIGAATVESSMEIPQKIKNKTAYDLVIPLLAIYQTNPKTLIQKNICTPMFTAVLFTIAKLWKQPRFFHICKYIYTMEYYSAIKRNKILPFVAAWMDLEGIMQSEISQSEKAKYHMISLICGI